VVLNVKRPREVDRRTKGKKKTKIKPPRPCQEISAHQGGGWDSIIKEGETPFFAKQPNEGEVTQCSKKRSIWRQGKKSKQKGGQENPKLTGWDEHAAREHLCLSGVEKKSSKTGKKKQEFMGSFVGGEKIQENEARERPLKGSRQKICQVAEKGKTKKVLFSQERQKRPTQTQITKQPTKRGKKKATKGKKNQTFNGKEKRTHPCHGTIRVRKGQDRPRGKGV